MGTNFYWLKEYSEIKRLQEQGIETELDDYSPTVHIGKRAAAGSYCYSCRVSLFSGGEEWVHGPPWGGSDPLSQSDIDLFDSMKMLQACPECGAEKGSEHVRGACSFCYAQQPNEVRQRCEQSLNSPCVIDGYDREYTGKEFLGELECCPIVKTELIGRRFG